MKRYLLLAALAGAACSPAFADNTVEFNDITAKWSNAVPSANVTFQNNGGATGTTNPRAYWGGEQSISDDSGYTFTVNGAQPIDVTLPPSPSPNFTLGTFQHINQPIPSGSSITGINLTVWSDVLINGVDQGVLSFLFHFTHNETPNADDPCADGGHVGSGVDSGGCADHVTISALAQTSTFDIGGDHYTLNINGFSQGGVQTAGFWTTEGLTNTADLTANVALYSDVVINPTGGVPEPSTWLLGLTGFGLVAALGWKRKRSDRLASI